MTHRPDLDNANVGRLFVITCELNYSTVFQSEILFFVVSKILYVHFYSKLSLFTLNRKKEEKNMSICNVSLQVVPSVEEDRLYEVVDKVIEYIASTGVKYEVGAMETTMEGELDNLLEIVKKAQEICTKEGASRVVSMVKIDYKDEGVTMDEKIKKYRK